MTSSRITRQSNRSKKNMHINNNSQHNKPAHIYLCKAVYTWVSKNITVLMRIKRTNDKDKLSHHIHNGSSKQELRLLIWNNVSMPQQISSFCSIQLQMLHCWNLTTSFQRISQAFDLWPSSPGVEILLHCVTISTDLSNTQLELKLSCRWQATERQIETFDLWPLSPWVKIIL